MTTTADISIRTANGHPLAAVEVKNLPELSLAGAQELCDALVEQLGRPVKYLLVVSQSKGYIWQRHGDGSRYDTPETLDLTPVLREYLTEAEITRHIRGADLDLVVSHWLGDLARGRGVLPQGTGDEGPFSRFFRDIRGAHITLEVLA